MRCASNADLRYLKRAQAVDYTAGLVSRIAQFGLAMSMGPPALACQRRLAKAAPHEAQATAVRVAARHRVCPGIAAAPCRRGGNGNGTQIGSACGYPMCTVDGLAHPASMIPMRRQQQEGMRAPN